MDEFIGSFTTFKLFIIFKLVCVCVGSWGWDLVVGVDFAAALHCDLVLQLSQLEVLCFIVLPPPVMGPIAIIFL